MNSSPSSTLPHQSITLQLYPGPSTCTPEWVNLCQSYKRKGTWKRFELDPRPYDYEIPYPLRRPLRTTDFHYERKTLPYGLRRAIILDETPCLLLCQLRDESVVWINKNRSDSQTLVFSTTPRRRDLSVRTLGDISPKLLRSAISNCTLSGRLMLFCIACVNQPSSK